MFQYWNMDPPVDPPVDSVHKFQAMDGPPMANSVRTSHAKS